jgi:hypothetical protein
MRRRALLGILLAVASVTTEQARQAPNAGRGTSGAITSPRAALGFDLGDDYQVANYTQLSSYWRTLDRESDRVSLVEYGRSSEGRPMLMAIVTSPENHRNLARYKEISRRLSTAEGLTEREAQALAAEGKAVVWIDAGLHATEIANTQALTEMLYQTASRNDPETRRFLNDVILLAAFSNPDGLELVANWYMREQDPLKRSMADLPVLYQKYIGHDNNRESLMCSMPESTAIARVLYREWFPQIMYNQHQSGPAGAVLFVGSMRDPSNPNLDPLMAPSMELVSAAVHTRYVAEGKPGAVSRSLAPYQNWYDGGVRSTACFHNQVAILSEITGSPTPTDIAFLPKTLVATNDNPFPIQPQKWHFRQAVEYLLTADRAFLDVASKHREAFLLNIFRMGRNSIDKGSRDNWTITSRKTAAVESAYAKDKGGPPGRGGYPMKYYDALRDPASRDARGYVLPSDQPDFLTATKFVNALIKNGIAVHRATSSFQAGGKTYPAGSYVVKTAQAFRPHVVDCFEPQDYPDDFPYPGGPPIRPYDVTGYTLAYEMGVSFDRVLEAFNGPFEKIGGLVTPPPGQVTGKDAVGYLLSHEVNDAFVAINQLVTSGEDVYWLTGPTTSGDMTYPAGTIYIEAKAATAGKLQSLARSVGLAFSGVTRKPTGEALKLKPVRIAVLDQYGGSMPSGWLQWVLGQFGFAFDVVYPPMLDKGELAGRYDVLVIENGLIPAAARATERRETPSEPVNIPAEYRTRRGSVSDATTIPQLRQFMADGGTILAIGNSASLGFRLGAPVSSAMVDESGRPVPAEKFFVQGAVLAARVDPTHPLAYGMPDRVDVVFDNNPVFRLAEGSTARRVAWFDSEKPLRSGWAWGQERLRGGAAIVEVDMGKGKLVLFGPLVLFRAHPHGTFKFLFNGIYYGSAERVRF